MSTVRNAWCLLGALLGAAGCATGRDTAAEVQRLQARAAFERGIAHVQAREGSPALAALREAVALDPGSALYRDTLGLVYSQLRRPDLALEQFQQATVLDPQFADGHFHLGVALAESGRWEEAVTAYGRAIALPTLTVPDLAHHNLGLAQFHLRRYPESERELRFAISLSPDMQAAYYHLGLVLAAQGRTEEARLAFTRSRTLGPDTTFGEAATLRLRALGGPAPEP